MFMAGWLAADAAIPVRRELRAADSDSNESHLRARTCAQAKSQGKGQLHRPGGWGAPKEATEDENWQSGGRGIVGVTQRKEACRNHDPHTLPEIADHGQKAAVKCQASPHPNRGLRRQETLPGPASSIHISPHCTTTCNGTDTPGLQL